MVKLVSCVRSVDYNGRPQALYEFYNDTTDERIGVFVSSTRHDPKSKYALMHRWVKNGDIDRFIEYTVSVDTYVYLSDGTCTGGYDPTAKRGGYGYVIDFDWMLEDTPDNRRKMLREIIRRIRNGER